MKRCSALVLLGLLAVGLFLLLWSQSEPRDEGKGISAWITQLGDTDPSRRQEGLHHKNLGVRANTLNAMITQRSWGEAERDAIIQCIADPNPGVRANAMFALNLFPNDKLRSASTNLAQVFKRAANDVDPVVRSFALAFQRKLAPPVK